MTVRSALIVTPNGFVFPAASPPQAVKPDPGSGTAVSVTVLPSGYSARSGLRVTLPWPVTLTVRACVVTAKVAVMLWSAETLVKV